MIIEVILIVLVLSALLIVLRSSYEPETVENKLYQDKPLYKIIKKDKKVIKQLEKDYDEKGVEKSSGKSKPAKRNIGQEVLDGIKEIKTKDKHDNKKDKRKTKGKKTL